MERLWVPDDLERPPPVPLVAVDALDPAPREGVLGPVAVVLLALDLQDQHQLLAALRENRNKEVRQVAMLLFLEGVGDREIEVVVLDKGSDGRVLVEDLSDAVLPQPLGLDVVAGRVADHVVDVASGDGADRLPRNEADVPRAPEWLDGVVDRKPNGLPRPRPDRMPDSARDLLSVLPRDLLAPFPSPASCRRAGL